MEIIINSPNLYIHLHDAVLLVQFIIDGFIDKREAMRCEWRLKRARGYLNRVKYIDYIFNNEEKFTKNGSEIKSLNLKIYSKKNYYKYFNNLELRELEWF